MKKGLLVVLSGPAGSGKGTVHEKLLQDGSFVYSVSATTRAPRPGEIHGREYWFITKEEFEDHIRRGDMLEYTNYCGNYYGTPRQKAEEVLASGKNLLLEIEVEGAQNIKRACPEAILIMLLPPSYAAQEARLRNRGTETEEKILARLARAKEELKLLSHYDYIVYNYDGKADDCADDVRAIVRAENRAVSRNLDAEEKFFAPA